MADRSKVGVYMFLSCGASLIKATVATRVAYFLLKRPAQNFVETWS